MSENAEGIGGRKWSFEKINGELCLMEGRNVLAALDASGESVKFLLVTAPQLWDAANQLLREPGDPRRLINLGHMVAKSVGKTDWSTVKQR